MSARSTRKVVRYLCFNFVITGNSVHTFLSRPI